MRYITKADEPDEFINWKGQENETLERYYEDDEIRAKHIWDYLQTTNPPFDRQIEGKVYYSKEELRNSLVNEQGGICCYCGQKLKKDNSTILEHLNAKSDDKRTTFQYGNIYASCEGSNSIKEYTVKKDRERIGDIAAIVGVDVNTLIELNPNSIVQLLDKGEKITIQIVNKHCDAAKGKLPIFIKPNQIDCEEKFIYGESGKIKPINEDTNDDTLNTINQLGLNNNINLKCKRAETLKNVTKSILYFRNYVNDDKAKLKQILRTLYENLNQFDKDGLLSEFCFIERFVLKKYIKDMNLND